MRQWIVKVWKWYTSRDSDTWIVRRALIVLPIYLTRLWFTDRNSAVMLTGLIAAGAVVTVLIRWNASR